MISKTNVTGRDKSAQKVHFCPLCVSKLSWRLGLLLPHRYRDLAKFFRKYDMPDQARWYQRQAERLSVHCRLEQGGDDVTCRQSGECSGGKRYTPVS